VPTMGGRRQSTLRSESVLDAVPRLFRSQPRSPGTLERNHHESKELMEASWPFRDEIARNSPEQRASSKALYVPSTKSETVQARLERLTNHLPTGHRNNQVRTESPDSIASMFPAGVQ
jgi:hypothetical protein